MDYVLNLYTLWWREKYADSQIYAQNNQVKKQFIWFDAHINKMLHIHTPPWRYDESTKILSRELLIIVSYIYYRMHLYYEYIEVLTGDPWHFTDTFNSYTEIFKSHKINEHELQKILSTCISPRWNCVMVWSRR